MLGEQTVRREILMLTVPLPSSSTWFPPILWQKYTPAMPPWRWPILSKHWPSAARNAPSCTIWASLHEGRKWWGPRSANRLAFPSACSPFLFSLCIPVVLNLSLSFSLSLYLFLSISSSISLPLLLYYIQVPQVSNQHTREWTYLGAVSADTIWMACTAAFCAGSDGLWYLPLRFFRSSMIEIWKTHKITKENNKEKNKNTTENPRI